MKLAGIGIGSNVGDPRRHIENAAEVMQQWGRNWRIASLMESDPVDCPEGSPLFLNTVAVLEVDLEPLELLRRMQQLEQMAGRQAPELRPRNAPRPLDLDLLFYGDELWNQPVLTLPHPRMMERLFVMQPLAELLPAGRLRADGPTFSEVLRKLKEASKVHRHER